MHELNVNLNVHEIGVILSALQTLDLAQEKLIAKEYGSTSALYNKLYSHWERMDQSSTQLQNDVIPSFWSLVQLLSNYSGGCSWTCWWVSGEHRCSPWTDCRLLYGRIPVTEQIKLILALQQVDGISKLIRNNEYESYFYSFLNPIHIELNRQLTNLKQSSKIKESN